MQGRILGISHGRQASQDEQGGLRQDFQGISDQPLHHHHSTSTQRLCREIVGWKHLSHPNILPLLGTSVLTDPDCFLILTEWMPSGNVMQYARSNPGANRLRLVNSLVVSPYPSSHSFITCSSLGPCPAWPTFTGLGSFMEILKG